jgi:hypothetical protein
LPRINHNLAAGSLSDSSVLNFGGRGIFGAIRHNLAGSAVLKDNLAASGAVQQKTNFGLLRDR